MSSTPRPTALLRAGLPILIALAAGCSSASSGSNAATTDTVHPRPSNCPSPNPVSAQFPAGASSDLPHPASAASPAALPVQVHGVTLLRFTTAMPLRDSVAFLLKQYPAAGYRVLQGDSEQDEADAPFVKGGLHGTTRLSASGPCSTTWLVAVTTGHATLDKIPQLQSHDDGTDSASNGD